GSTVAPGLQPVKLARLIVSDTGTGMSPEVRAKIFEPFFTTKGPGKGTGLGLATVYGIVKQSGGSIGADRRRGMGPPFRIYLPRVDDAVAASHAFDEDVRPGDGSETVLLVEDEPALRDLAREVLETFGYIVIEAAGPEQALQRSAARPGAIHLLVTDVVMPGMNGRQLATLLCEQRPELRVLFM